MYREGGSSFLELIRPIGTIIGYAPCSARATRRTAVTYCVIWMANSAITESMAVLLSRIATIIGKKLPVTVETRKVYANTRMHVCTCNKISRTRVCERVYRVYAPVYNVYRCKCKRSVACLTCFEFIL